MNQLTDPQRANEETVMRWTLHFWKRHDGFVEITAEGPTEFPSIDELPYYVVPAADLAAAEKERDYFKDCVAMCDGCNLCQAYRELAFDAEKK